MLAVTDTETCGFHGVPVLIQYAFCEPILDASDDPMELLQQVDKSTDVHLHHIWRVPIHDTMSLIEDIVTKDFIGFNVAFDWFHISKIYTMLYKYLELGGSADDYPMDQIQFLAELEPLAARVNLCLKPTGCCDLLSVSRMGEFQSLMRRKPIRIRRVPACIAYELADELTQRIELPDIFFARKKNPKHRWSVLETKSKDFKTLEMSFEPKSGLKTLVAHITGKSTIAFDEVGLSDRTRPSERGFAPFWKCAAKPALGWPTMLQYHIDHWFDNIPAQKYARDDVVYTRFMYEYFKHPPTDDLNSILACKVASCRWRGYSLDTKKLDEKIKEAEEAIQVKGFSINAPHTCKRFLEEVMSDSEKIILDQGTKDVILKEIATWENKRICETCAGLGSDILTNTPCATCNGLGSISTGEVHPAAERASVIRAARKADKALGLYKKLALTGRLHADFKVVGTKSGRMAGSSGLNAQGINKGSSIRSMFTLADGDYVLCGGDFDAFEVGITDAIYQDPDLRADLDQGKKIHALFGSCIFPQYTYEELCANEEVYGKSKSGFFALIYFGNEETLKNKLGVTVENAKEGIARFMTRYKKFGTERTRYAEMFCSMRQPNGIGTKVEWHEPEEYIESMFGFRRYFTLENRLCKELFDLSNNLPEAWGKYKIKVCRRDREQSVVGAVQSALYGAAFQVQGSNMRAAGNHVIQSTGSHITKMLEYELWSLQPVGIHPFKVLPMNIHDEVMCPAAPDVVGKTTEIVNDFISRYKQHIPMLGMKWKTHLESWASKK